MRRARGRARGVSVSSILWELLPAALLVAVFSGVGVMHVMSRVEVVDSAYRLSRLEQESRGLAQENERLKLELATLKSPARLEKVARQQLGMRPPPAGAVLTVPPPSREARDASVKPLSTDGALAQGEKR